MENSNEGPESPAGGVEEPPFDEVQALSMTHRVDGQ
jgi:hypothetical protein